ncbi:WXG100-like domain-containing protein, partial [Nocardia takedensis]
MSLELPEGLHWLGWVAGAPWPKGDEDQAFAVSRAWSEAAEELRGQLSQVRAAKEATEASYISGAGGAEMLA